MAKEKKEFRLIKDDSWLKPYKKQIDKRYQHYLKFKATVEEAFGSVDHASRGHEYFGFHRLESQGVKGIIYREWAPAAYGLFLFGDFNSWDRLAHPMKQDKHGVWEIFLPDVNGRPQISNGTHVKVCVSSDAGREDRIPAYIHQVVQDTSNNFDGIFFLNGNYRWEHEQVGQIQGLKIYEAHVGLAQEKKAVGSFDEFRKEVLPRIAKGGYNAIQLMAIMQHPYYGSFGYHVSSFFAVSHYFGTPNQLKQLIDEAHNLGVAVLLDIVHSHTVKNTQEGLNLFDGSDYQYFHAGHKGDHPAWDSKLFNYAKPEVLRFLLSNVRYWLEEFKFDGLRFDGVTSMVYEDHGLGRDFNGYDDYFDDDNLNIDAVAYLQLANVLAHEVNPNCITIAEEVSGIPGLCYSPEDGGIGFDYRLSMGVPDYWIKILKELKDEDWKMEQVFGTMTNRRHMEKHIAYCESHDQALVGDKTIAFWLMDAAMYTDMAIDCESLVIDRGIALHKMIRLMTFGFAGEGWLNFIGNEFGHPEWLDFPREGNNFSFQHARRQWSLADSPFLKYQFLNNFDQAMLNIDQDGSLLEDGFIQMLYVHEEDKLLIARRGPYVFAFNFHGENSYSDFALPVPDATDYELILSTDEEDFGGFSRVVKPQNYIYSPIDGGNKIQAYLPARTAIVFAPKEFN
ncbi:MAG: alpha-amylase family glycosyl hydrolase [Lentisphaeria bacterium]|nr:alpha-amylase family glycosyl hydrolase [Lentisphaeria bacterium]